MRKDDIISTFCLSISAIAIALVCINIGNIKNVNHTVNVEIEEEKITTQKEIIAEEETTISIDELIASIKVEPVTYDVVSQSIIEETDVMPSYYVEVVDGRITPESLASICEWVGADYELDPKLLQAIAWVESTYRVGAVSHCNAKGLCQIMEVHHKGRMEKLGITDIFDPYSNVLLCADIISDYKGSKYGDDIRFALMAYNMGVSGATGPYEDGVISNYAIKVMNKWDELKAQ